MTICCEDAYLTNTVSSDCEHEILLYTRICMYGLFFIYGLLYMYIIWFFIYGLLYIICFFYIYGLFYILRSVLGSCCAGRSEYRRPDEGHRDSIQHAVLFAHRPFYRSLHRDGCPRSRQQELYPFNLLLTETVYSLVLTIPICHPSWIIWDATQI